MEELLKQQYQREEKTRLKNKQAERLLHYGIESKTGMRALHEYRIQIVNRQQKELVRELERIQAGMPQKKIRVTASANQDHSSLKESKSSTSKSHGKPWPLVSNQREKTTTSIAATAPAHHSRKPSKNIYDDDYGEDDFDDDYSSSDNDNKEEPIPDPDVLKAIMRGMVSDWEHRASIAVESHRRQSIANAIPILTTPELIEPSSILTSDRQKQYRGRNTSKWKTARDHRSPNSSRLTKDGEKRRNQSHSPNSVTGGSTKREKQAGASDKTTTRNGNNDRSVKSNNSPLVPRATKTAGASGVNTEKTHHNQKQYGGFTTRKKKGREDRRGGRQGKIHVDKKGAHFLQGLESEADYNNLHSATSFTLPPTQTRNGNNVYNSPCSKLREGRIGDGSLSDRGRMFF